MTMASLKKIKKAVRKCDRMNDTLPIAHREVNFKSVFFQKVVRMSIVDGTPILSATVPNEVQPTINGRLWSYLGCYKCDDFSCWQSWWWAGIRRYGTNKPLQCCVGLASLEGKIATPTAAITARALAKLKISEDASTKSVSTRKPNALPWHRENAYSAACLMRVSGGDQVVNYAVLPSFGGM